MSASTPFYRVCWTLRARTAIRVPPVQHALLYAVLCEAARGDGSPHLPDGLLLDAPEQCRNRIASGSDFHFGATLIETDPRRAAHRLHLISAGLVRVGRERPQRAVAMGGNFDLVEVRDPVADRSLSPGDPFVAVPIDRISEECVRLSDCERLTLRFHSPLRLERPGEDATEGHQFVDGQSLRPGQLIRAIQKRLAALGIRRAEPEPPFTDDQVQLFENRLVWVDLEYGNRDRRKALGGAMGRVVLSVPDPVVRAALVWGQYARLGKNLHFGFGRFRIEELGPDPNASPRSVPLLDLALRDEEVLGAATLSQADALDTLRAAAELRTGHYRPEPSRPLRIHDPDGAPRLLRVPSRRDRALQRALLSCLGPPLDQLFEQSSFAWRSGLGREAAARRIQRLFREGWHHAVSADFDRFFDSVPRRLLRDRLEAWLGDDDATAAVMAFVEADAGEGLPTGAPLSPLLGNLLLDHFDEAIQSAGGRLVRYGDDFLVLTRNRLEAERLHAEAVRLADGLLLTLNDGSAVIDLSEPFSFLGFRFLAEDCWSYAGPEGPRRVQELGWRDADRSDRLPAVLLPGEQSQPVAGGVVILGPETTLVDVVGDELRTSRDAGQAEASYPLAGLDRVIAFGPTGWTPDALGKLLRAEVVVQLVSTGGWPEGELHPLAPDDPDALVAQCRAAGDPAVCLRIGRVLIRAKIHNFATLLATLSPDDVALTPLREFARDCDSAPTLDSLRGTEGAAAALWYSRLGHFVGRGFTFRRRVAPDADDPVNLLLNLAHTQMYRHAMAAARAAGLSPAVGFMHRGDGRYAALAADLQEPFRHLAERAVVVATRQLRPTQFVPRSDGPHSLVMEHHAGTRFHALLQRGLRLAVVGRGQSEPRAWLAQMLATARSLRRHLLDPTIPFEAFEYP